LVEAVATRRKKTAGKAHKTTRREKKSEEKTKTEKNRWRALVDPGKKGTHKQRNIDATTNLRGSTLREEGPRRARGRGERGGKNERFLS